FGTKAILNASSTATRFTTTDIAATPDWPESRRLSAVALPSTKNRKPAIIPLAKTLQRPLSDPGGCLSCVSPRTGDRGRPWHECAGLKPARTHHRGCESGDAAPRPTGRPRSLDQQSTPPLDCWSQR